MRGLRAPASFNLPTISGHGDPGNAISAFIPLIWHYKMDDGLDYLKGVQQEKTLKLTPKVRLGNRTLGVNLGRSIHFISVLSPIGTLCL